MIPLFAVAIAFANPQIEISNTKSIPMHLGGRIVREVKSSEKLGSFEMDKIEITKEGKNLGSGRPEQIKNWAKFLFDHINSNGFQKDETNWFQSYEKVVLFAPINVLGSSLFRGGGKNWCVLELRTKGRLEPKKGRPPENVRISTVGLLLLDSKLQAAEVKRSFGGMVRDGESRRILTPLYWVDLDQNKHLDLVIRDERYAGAFALVLYFEDKGIRLKGVHIDAWD